MYLCLRLTGIATLLIGLQLFGQKIVDANVERSVPDHISFNQSLVAINGNGSQGLNQIAQLSSDFEPPDNGHPPNTRGSGTR